MASSLSSASFQLTSPVAVTDVDRAPPAQKRPRAEINRLSKSKKSKASLREECERLLATNAFMASEYKKVLAELRIVKSNYATLEKKYLALEGQFYDFTQEAEEGYKKIKSSALMAISQTALIGNSMSFFQVRSEPSHSFFQSSAAPNGTWSRPFDYPGQASPEVIAQATSGSDNTLLVSPHLMSLNPQTQSAAQSANTLSP